MADIKGGYNNPWSIGLNEFIVAGMNPKSLFSQLPLHTCHEEFMK